MRKYHQLSLEEREKIYAWKLQGVTLREIGRRLKRNHTSLSRELKRNKQPGTEYISCKAHERSIKRGVDQRHHAPLKNPLIFLYVRRGLRRKWSPEEIEGRLPIDFPGYSITDETIYRYIYKRWVKRLKFWRYLTLRRKKRMKHRGCRPRRDSKIPNARGIDRRPKIINERKTIGHWESDNMEGIKTDKTAVSVTVERSLRLAHLTKVAGKKSDSKTMAVTTRLQKYPRKLRKTITLDNGSENTYHQIIKINLNMNVYFCHAYHSWEKGTVENTIGRLRRYLPKGKSLDHLTDEKLKQIEEEMNNTPRKCLGFLTPYEKLNGTIERNPV
jgi:IS30 family transposase